MLRRFALLVVVALSVSACSGSGGGGGDGGNGGDGSTSTPPPPESARFEMSFSAGDATVAVEGYSCEGAAGPWNVTLTVSGSATGSGTSSFAFDEGEKSTKMTWSFPAEAAGGTATYSGDTKVFLNEARPSLSFFGTLTVESPAGSASGPANEKTPISFEVVEECA